MTRIMTQIALNPSTSFCNSWTSKEYDRNRSNWLERLPRSHHYSRRRTECLNHTLTTATHSMMKSFQDLKQDNPKEGILGEDPTFKDYKESILDVEQKFAVQNCSSKYSRRNHKISLKLKKTEDLKIEMKNTNYLRDDFVSDMQISNSYTTFKNNDSNIINDSYNKNGCSNVIVNGKLNCDKDLFASDTLNINSIKKRKKIFESILSTPPPSLIEVEPVSVPCWRIQGYTGKYVIEGTEDLSDNVFEDRHCKHESSERKRKKRDEKCLEDLEKLNKLKNKRNNTSNELSPKNKVHFIEITVQEPRCIFGSVVPDTKLEDFFLPADYFTSSTYCKSHSKRKRNTRY